MDIESNCLHAGYSPKNGEAEVVPICQSTAFKYDSTDQVAKLFDLREAGFFYSRIGNPTVDAVEKKIAILEGGVGALCTASGQAATMIAVLNILSCGDHLVSSSALYGGSYNLFAITFKKMGISVTFIDPDASEDAIQKAFRPETKAVFAETISNPGIKVLDIEKFSRIAHLNKVPLIVDNTFATPILCKAFEYGADIIVHSTSKYLEGHAVQLGGVIVDSGKFDWTNGKFPEFTEKDPSYHGLIYSESFGEAAYIVKARVQLMRDMGPCQSPHGAFLLNQGLATLPLRMQQHSSNALAVAEFLEKCPQVEKVFYPQLPSSAYYDLTKKYLPKGCSGVVSFVLKGGRDAGSAFIDNLKMISLLVHVANVRSCVLHPASSTHRQLSDEQLHESGVEAGMVRFSVGIESLRDILEDVEQSLAQLK